MNDKCSLQSFGDANGNCFDFYRFFRRMERESIPAKFKDTEAILHKNYGGANKDILLSEVLSLVQTGQCAPATMNLLERFSYMQNGNIFVPIYTPEHRKYIMEIEGIIEKCLGAAMSRTLNDLATSIDFTAVKHGVNRLEIANELYHILFGSINEELVLRKIAADPLPIPGEGRNFRCIEVYE